MKEFTIKAVVLGLVMCVVLGAANAYLGLKAGMTIAATYPAAVIGMAILRLMKGSILEENLARTVGSIGESVAAGAIFTIPAFLISGLWPTFATKGHYLLSSVIMFVGGVLGVLFVAILRRVMVEDVDLPFPESVAAGEIHKAGRSGGTGAKFLFGAMGIGAAVQMLGQFNIIATSWSKFVGFSKTVIGLAGSGKVAAQGGIVLSSPAVSPAYMGVGYIIGPKLASLNFSGGLLAWGLFVPILVYFLTPSLLASGAVPADADWLTVSKHIWKFIVRPIAVGGMLASAIFTLYKMRNSLFIGLKRSINDVKKAASGTHSVERTEHDLSFVWVLSGIVLCAIATFVIFYSLSHNILAAIVAGIVMVITGFFFSAVAGYLVGMIGSSNNPVSGLTLCTLFVVALTMVLIGVKGPSGIAAVLGVAAVACVAAAVAGEMLQDLKVGHILGGTPWKMQIGDIIGVAVAAAVMFLPLYILHQGDIQSGGTGLGGEHYPAPQASLMAMLTKGIVGGEMAWPLVIVGLLMGIGFILMQVRSPMLVSVGMYLPLETTFTIFVGGLVKGIIDRTSEKRKHNAAQKARIENTGVLLASGLIAGEALVGLLFAGLAIPGIAYEKWLPGAFSFLPFPFVVSIGVLALIAWYVVAVPVKNAGKPDDPAPPTPVM
jgi:putative OPT family oligopeptide transporter